MLGTEQHEEDCGDEKQGEGDEAQKAVAAASLLLPVRVHAQARGRPTPPTHTAFGAVKGLVEQ